MHAFPVLVTIYSVIGSEPESAGGIFDDIVNRAVDHGVSEIVADQAVIFHDHDPAAGAS